ncbi:hypothetical protein Nepgr_011458 [Nepenthes gracilis]|uniref:RING-CH-type domain-containing protein n=1 Tax=Nepenthes gracilis TaxID=150966 RepID=A0AAD3SFH8_NEPGR|nr:hypothetical protein Nepgr_011458 [Nepenthes gracilis]
MQNDESIENRIEVGNRIDAGELKSIGDHRVSVHDFPPDADHNTSAESGNQESQKFAEEGLPDVASPKKYHLPRTASSHEQCRVCQQEEEEILIELGCQCRGGLAKAHESCINNWFRTRGSNKCEICQHVAANVSPPEPSPNANYQVWRGDQVLRQPGFAPEHETGCFSPLWVAFSILIGGLLLDVLISISLGVSPLPVNIIIGVIVLLGLGTAFRLALEFCHQWSVRRLVQVDANVNQGYHPAL